MSEPCETCGHSLDTHDSGESQDGCRFQFGWGTECDCGWPVAAKTTEKPQPPVGGEGVRAHDPQEVSDDRSRPWDGCSGRGRPSCSAAECMYGLDQTLKPKAGMCAFVDQGSVIPAALGDRRLLAPPDIEVTSFREAQVEIERLTQALAAGEARAAALQAEVDVLHNCGIIEIAVRNKSGSVSDYMTHWEGRALKAEALLQKQDDLAPLDVIWREKFESYVRRAEAAEAAIVSLQADYKGFELELFDVGEALDGQFPSQEPCVARAVQQQREALDRVQDELRTLQAQLQAITQEIREESERIAGGERPPVDSFELKVWADALDAAAKGQQ